MILLRRRIEVSSLFVCPLVECVGVGVYCLVGEVEYSLRIYGISHESGLEMQVRAGASSGISAKSYRFAGFYILVGFHKEFGEMSVDSLKPVGVTYDDIIPVAFSLKVRKAHSAVKSGSYGIAYMQF